jgi:hypothetical protein
MAKMITSFLYRLHPFMFVIQFVGFISAFLMFMIFIVFGGGLDLSTSGYEPAGLNGTCIILPFAFVLTLFTFLSSSKLKNQTIVIFLLLSALILNLVLAVQALTLLVELLDWLF